MSSAKDRSKDVPAGLPGQPEQLTLVNQYSEGDPRNTGPLGAPGVYRVVLTLSRPGIRRSPEYSVTFESGLQGDSHLGFAKPFYAPPGNPDATEMRIQWTSPDESFLLICRPNDRGFLSKIELSTVKAESFEDAVRKSYRAVAANLSVLSLQLDIPLFIFQTDLTEVGTGNTRLMSMNPYQEVPCVINAAFQADADLQALAALYREALGTNSLIYQYLCLFKLLDGVRIVRTRAKRAATRAGESFNRREERVPNAGYIPWLNALFTVRLDWQNYHVDAIFPRQARGKLFSKLLDPQAELTQLRNEIAHALTVDSRTLLDLDDHLFQMRVAKWLPLLKVMARRMLTNEFPNAFLSHLPDSDPASS